MSDSYIQAVEKNIDAAGERTDEIFRLREENARLRADLADQRLVSRDNLDWFSSLKTEYDALREENARLRAALKPFVERLEVLEKMATYKYVCGTDIAVEHLRAASAAIREGGEAN